MVTRESAAKSIGARLQYLRKNAGLTQDEACDHLNLILSKYQAKSVCRSSICNYERGYRVPQIVVLKALSELYGEDLLQYICGSSEEFSMTDTTPYLARTADAKTNEISEWVNRNDLTTFLESYSKSMFSNESEKNTASIIMQLIKTFQRDNFRWKERSE